jgi:uncharacterized protein YukE
MLTRTHIAAIVAALAAIAALPAVANAASVPMRGVVSGSPYGASNGQMAIPVLFSKDTASKAGLKSPVGVIIVGRNQKVQLPGGGSTIPVNLRNGDRFKGTGIVGALQRKVFYPRIVFPTAIVYFRSKELSLAELSLAVESLKKSLGDLATQLDTLKGATAKAFQDVYAQLADLRNQLAALAALKVPDFQAQIDALTKKLNDLIASLPDFSKFALITQLPDLSLYALKSQLPDLTGYAKLTDLTAALAGYATKAYVDGQISGLQSQITTITSTTIPNAITTAVAGLASTTYVDAQVATLKTKINQLVNGYTTLCTQLKGISSLPAIGAAVNCPAVAPLP